LLGCKSLETINLAWNNISGDGVQGLTDALAPMGKLQELDIKYNNIGLEGAIAVGSLLKENSSLTVLDLVKNGLPPEAAPALADALKVNSSIQVLNLGMNALRDEGLAILAAALETNTSLTVLEAEKNGIGPDGADALARVLAESNTTLTALELQENCIGDRGAEKLAIVLMQNVSLKRLDLRQNEITDAGAGFLADACSEGGGIEELDLCQNDLSAAMHERLKAVAEETGPRLSLYHKPLAGVVGEEEDEEDEEASHGSWEDLPGAEGLAGEFEADAASPESSPEQGDPTATVQRMLGIVEDHDDIAFDNATWYLNSQPELSTQLWEMALEAEADAPKIRCLEIFRHVVQQSTANQATQGLPAESLPPQVYSIYEHLTAVVALLTTPPAEKRSLVTTFGEVPERFGLLRSCALDLLVDCIETRNLAMCDEIARLEALPEAFGKFFVYKWNSALHATVLKAVELIFDVEDAGNAMSSLQRRLLAPAPEGCGFLARLMDSYYEITPDEVEVAELDAPQMENSEPLDPLSAAVEQKLVAASREVGYMSAVVDMALCFRMASNSLALRELFDEIHPAEEAAAPEEGEQGSGQGVAARWEAFSAEVLERVDDMSPEKRCLGGEKPRPNPTCGQM